MEEHAQKMGFGAAARGPGMTLILGFVGEFPPLHVLRERAGVRVV